MMQPYHQGDEAGRANRPYSANPFARDTNDHACWENGWRHGNWVWAQQHATETETLTCRECRAEGERVFLSAGEEVWDPDGYLYSEDPDFYSSRDGAEPVGCDGCHTVFFHRRADAAEHYDLAVDERAFSSPSGRVALRPPTRGLVYVVRSGGRIRIGKASSSKRYVAYKRALPHGAELLKRWDLDRPLSWESHLHARYRRYRVHGSWYEIPDEQLSELLQLDPPDDTSASSPNA